jgi:hypothetical protein
MGDAEPRFWIELICAVTVPVGLLAIIINRIWLRKSLTVRTIQLVSLIVVLPLMTILSLEKILDGSAIAALLGALVGYLFSNIGRYDEGLNSDRLKD